MVKPVPSVTRDTQKTALGILLMILGMAVFNAMDTVSKVLTADFSGVQVTWARYTFHLVPLVLLAGPARVMRMARTEQPWAQVLRSAAYAVSAICIIVAFSLMPLADAIAVSFVAPLMIVAMSGPMLGERVGPHRWVAVVAGFAGVLVLVWPSGDVLDVGALFAVAAAVFWAVGQIMTRRVREDDPWSTLFYTALVGTFMLSVAVLFSWRPPSANAWGLMCVMGVLGGTAHLLVINAFRHASASLLAPYNYTMMLWATFFGWLVFSELPDQRTTAGAAIIIAAGLYAWHREQARQERKG